MLKQSTDKSWWWGVAGYKTKEEAIRAGLKIEGPKKFQKIIREYGVRAFAGYEGLQLARSVFDEKYRSSQNVFMHGVAAYLASNASDGDNDTDKDNGGMLDSKVVDNAGDLSNNYSDTGDGMGNEFNKKKDDADFGESEQGLQPPTIADVNDDSSLEKHRGNVGVDIIIPPRNDKASPETTKDQDPDGKAPYDVPSKDDSRPKANLYQDEEKEAVTASLFEGYSHSEALIILDHLAFAYVSQKTRDSMDSSDFGLPSEKKFPVQDENHFHAAVKLMGRESPEKQAIIKRNLRKIAERKGYKIPDSWKSEGNDFVENAGNQPGV